MITANVAVVLVTLANTEREMTPDARDRLKRMAWQNLSAEDRIAMRQLVSWGNDAEHLPNTSTNVRVIP